MSQKPARSIHTSISTTGVVLIEVYRDGYISHKYDSDWMLSSPSSYERMRRLVNRMKPYSSRISQYGFIVVNYYL
jgi:hypothetical protein